MDEVTNFWTRFVPHSQHDLWRSDILWLNVLSDSIIAVVYFAVALFFVVLLRRRSVGGLRNIIGMFSALTFVCGMTHLTQIWTVWNGDYGMQGALKGATALLSIATVIVLIPAMPRLMMMRNPAELEHANRDLQAEIALQQEVTAGHQRAKTRFRTFLEQAQYGVLIVNQTSVIEFANAATGSLFAYAPDDLIGISIERVIPGIARAGHKNQYGDLFSAPYLRPISMELKGLGKDNREFPIEMCLSPIEMNGEVMVLASVLDITDEKASEEKTMKQLNELAHVARLATVEQMASGMAHELNQPLTAISQNCDTALAIVREEEKINPQLFTILEENYEYCQRAGQIIQSLRRMVQKGRDVKLPGDINTLVINVEKLIQAEATAANVEVSLELADNLPQVPLDFVQIQQVLVNLERNAIEALGQISDRSRELSISTCLAGSNTIKVTVRDNGPGIDPQYADELFKPYVTNRISGIGLGLSISRRIVEAHSGILLLEKTDGLGATFCFTLPTTEEA